MTVTLIVLLYRKLNVHILYCMQLNCTNSSCSVTNVECVTVQHIECTDRINCRVELY